MTPATKALDLAGIAYDVVSYPHDPSADSYGGEAADALGLDQALVFKTLVANVDSRSLVVAVVPVGYRLDLKALARSSGAKKATMANPSDAERSSGYVVGGISPLGQRKQLPTVIDDSCTEFDKIYVSAGKRGVEIAMAPADLVDALSATVARIRA